MNLLIVIPRNGLGGAERTATELANAFARNGINVSLVGIAGSVVEEGFPISESVSAVNVSVSGSITGVARIFTYLKRVLSLRRAVRRENADAILSLLTPVNNIVLLATLGIPVRVVVSERTNPAAYSYGSLTNLNRKILYRFAYRVVAQTDAAKYWLEKNIKAEVEVIPNFISENRIRVSGQLGKDDIDPVIVSVGRLIIDKGFDSLIRAFVEIKNFFPTARLRIVGDGPERENLMQLIRNLGLCGVVEMGGRVADISSVLGDVQLYVQCSYREGFPNSLLEAMWVGLPVIATYEAGDMLVTCGVNGKLYRAGNVDDLVCCMRELLGSPRLRERLGTEATKVRGAFCAKEVLPRWERVLFHGLRQVVG